MTSSPIATSDDVFAFGFECEVRIKRRDAVDFSRWNVESFGDECHDVFGEVFEFLLSSLQYRHEHIGLAPNALDNRVYARSLVI